MTRRCAALIWPGVASAAAPPGIDPVAYSGALFEDVAEVLQGLAGVDSLVVCGAGESAAVRDLVWPDVPVVEVADPGVRAAAAVADERGYQLFAAVAIDAPDLPPLLLAKLFQALSRSAVAVAAAARPTGGEAGAVAVGMALPIPSWVPASVDLDRPTVVADLRAAAPDLTAIEVTPGWGRLRVPMDVSRLDPGLEGWEATRALLAGLSSPRGA